MINVRFVSVVISLFVLSVNAVTSNIHWSSSGGGVGNFEDPSRWVEGVVPDVDDFVIVKNFAGFNADWVVNFTNNEINLQSQLVASTNNYSTTFNLNGYAWELTAYIDMWSGLGGKIIFTNGIFKTPLYDFDVAKDVGGSAVASLDTNLILELKDVVCETSEARFSSASVTLSGGSLSVSNKLTIGKPNYGIGTMVLEHDALCTLSNILYVGESAGSTGSLVNIDGQLEHTGGLQTFNVGYGGYGTLTVEGGTIDMVYPPVFGSLNTGVGVLHVTGGNNAFGSAGSGRHLTAGSAGTGYVWADGGTNSSFGIDIGSGGGSHGEMILTAGQWNLASYSYIGRSGTGHLMVKGGQLNSGSIFCIGRSNGGYGDVVVTGGVFKVPGEVRLGGDSGSTGQLTITGTGVARVNYISEYNAGAISTLICDGGTLQANVSGRLIRSVDNVLLTANGMMLDTLGRDVSIESELKNASGEAGSFTKTGSGTVTLAAGRTATGPVSVLQGTLVASNDLAVTASGTLSKIDDTLTLATDKRLIIGAGAAVSGAGSVSRLTLQDNAVVARDKIDAVTTPLSVGDGVADNHVAIELTGYSLDDLRTALPLISAPTAFIDKTKITVNLDGISQPFILVYYEESNGNQVLFVKYSPGTVIMVL